MDAEPTSQRHCPGIIRIFAPASCRQSRTPQRARRIALKEDEEDRKDSHNDCRGSKDIESPFSNLRAWAEQSNNDQGNRRLTDTEV